MVKLVNRAKMSTATTGTGTITLGTSESGYQSFADAGVVDGDVVRYVIEDGVNWEIGTGTYTASGTTLTRTVSESSNAGAAITLTGSAVVFVSASQYDVPIVRGVDPAVDTNPPNVGAVWVNSTSGSMFVCTDNTVGDNVWREVDGTSTVTSRIDYLVVAGGGGGSGGATGLHFGGGGAAGVIRAGTLTPVSAQQYLITVGAGSTGTLTSTGLRGGESAFGEVTATGGNANPHNNAIGGSNDDFAGGDATGVGTAPNGGGAGSGGSGSALDGGVAGTSNITGTVQSYGGGGAGRNSIELGTAGSGGGTAGNLGGNGVANTGSGGGGGNAQSGGGNGGSGVVILRSPQAATATTGSPIVITDGEFTIYKFTGSGSITF